MVTSPIPINKTLRDLDARERVSLWPVAIAALVMGVAPMLWLHSISPSVTERAQAGFRRHAIGISYDHSYD